MLNARHVEALVAATGLLIALCTIVLAPTAFAVATSAGAAFAAANFSLSRYTLKRVVATGPRRSAFGLLYVVKFFLLLLLLLLATQRWKLDVWGLVLGFTTLPAAMYALLAIALVKRSKG